MGPRPTLGQWSYLECGHGWVPAIPVYGVELGRVVELMVQLRMSFASVHHFLEGKKGRDSKNEPNRKKKKAKGCRGQLRVGRRAAVGKKMRGCKDASHGKGLERNANKLINCWLMLIHHPVSQSIRVWQTAVLQGSFCM